MTTAECSTDAMSNDSMTGEKKARSVQLYFVLILLCTGRALDRIANAPHGWRMEAWRMLFQAYSLKNNARLVVIMLEVSAFPLDTNDVVNSMKKVEQSKIKKFRKKSKVKKNVLQNCGSLVHPQSNGSITSFINVALRLVSPLTEEKDGLCRQHFVGSCLMQQRSAPASPPIQLLSDADLRCSRSHQSACRKNSPPRSVWNHQILRKSILKSSQRVSRCLRFLPSRTRQAAFSSFVLMQAKKNVVQHPVPLASAPQDLHRVVPGYVVHQRCVRLICNMLRMRRTSQEVQTDFILDVEVSNKQAQSMSCSESDRTTHHLP